MTPNVDSDVVRSFGQEWKRFDQSPLSEQELQDIFRQYFEIFPWERVSESSVGFDLGCGSGRWARFVAPRVGQLHCIDPSEALEVAQDSLAAFRNCTFHRASVDAMPLPNSSMDFGYSLGVLHHVPDTQAGINECVRKLKPGAPLLIYLYYAFDNRPAWFRWLWRASDALRKTVSKTPYFLRTSFAFVAAALLYWPLARLAWILEKLGLRGDHLPLAAYRTRSFYVMRNDALDRFGTSLEKRFTRAQVEGMMIAAGLEQIRFSDRVFWCAVGYAKNP